MWKVKASYIYLVKGNLQGYSKKKTIVVKNFPKRRYKRGVKRMFLYISIVMQKVLLSCHLQYFRSNRQRALVVAYCKVGSLLFISFSWDNIFAQLGSGLNIWVYDVVCYHYRFKTQYIKKYKGEIYWKKFS